jgi:hypothetical protein
MKKHLTNDSSSSLVSPLEQIQSGIDQGLDFAGLGHNPAGHPVLGIEA